MCSICWLHKWKKNTQLDNVKGIVVVMPVYNLIEYSDNYLKLFGSLLQYFRDEPVLNDAGAIIDFPDADINSASLKLKKYQVNQEMMEQKIFK